MGHSNVTFENENMKCKHEVNFDQMTFDQYNLGETQILNKSKISLKGKMQSVYAQDFNICTDPPVLEIWRGSF